MKLKIYQVDAFASRQFEGNPAAVCPLEDWLPDETMQNIATENNLSETAFFIPHEDGFYLRWFTPNGEVDLCGHATLATAHVLYNHIDYNQPKIIFQSRSGPLKVKKEGRQLVMDFPADKIQLASTPEAITEGLKVEIIEAYKGATDMMLVVGSEQELLAINPDFRRLKGCDCRGVIVTAPGTDCDFVSRCFYPSYGIDEDPVTGSAHTTMTPYWANRLQKNVLTAKQLSSRGGSLTCSLLGDRVEITGSAVTFMEGDIELQ